MQGTEGRNVRATDENFVAQSYHHYCGPFFNEVFLPVLINELSKERRGKTASPGSGLFKKSRRSFITNCYE
jgi:hypothetical protein